MTNTFEISQIVIRPSLVPHPVYGSFIIACKTKLCYTLINSVRAPVRLMLISDGVVAGMQLAMQRRNGFKKLIHHTSIVR